MTTLQGPAAAGELLHVRTMRRLHELIAALDRRASSGERVGEKGVVLAAATLRREALDRLAELERHANEASPAADAPLRPQP
jgi:hypothetical protein